MTFSERIMEDVEDTQTMEASYDAAAEAHIIIHNDSCKISAWKVFLEIIQHF